MSVELFRDRFALRSKSYQNLLWSLSKTEPFLDRVSMDDEGRESIEACFSRFETTVELLLNQISKSIELHETWINDWTLRDRLHLMEKLWLIQNTEAMITLREVRNKLAHSYVDDQFFEILALVHSYSNILKEVFGAIEIYLQKA